MQFRLLHFYMKVNKLVKQATASIYIANPATLQIIVVRSEAFYFILSKCANLDAKLYWVIDQGAGNGVDHATNKCGDLDQKVKAPSEENDKSKAHKLPVLARWN